MLYTREASAALSNRRGPLSLLSLAHTLMDFDHELLLSVASGLGRWSDGPDGVPTYTKDEDCVGELRRETVG